MQSGEMVNEIIRIGFVGGGANTRKMHLPGFRVLPGVELRAVCNRRLKSAEAVAEEFGIERVYEDWRDLVNDPQVDAVCIGTWPYLHAEVTIASLRAGKHVMTEARMAMNAQEAAHMLAVSREYPHLVTQVVPAPFSFRMDATVRRMLSGREAGDLREVVVRHRNGAGVDRGAAQTWRQSRALSGDNVLTMGILHETVMRWTGLNPRWVQADGQIWIPQRAAFLGEGLAPIDVADVLTITGRFPGETRLLYDFSSMAAGENVFEISLHGSEASLRADFLSNTLLKASVEGQGWEEVVIEPEDEATWQVEADFIDAIRGRKEDVMTTFAEGYRYMVFTSAVSKSWRGGGRKVYLSDVEAGTEYSFLSA